MIPLRSGHPSFGTVGSGLRPSFHAELGDQRRNVVLHRLLGEKERLAALTVGQNVGDQLENLLLAASTRSAVGDT